MSIIETPRLTLRQFTLADAEFFFELNSDPEVMKYTGEAAFNSIEDTKTFIEEYSDFRRFGMGRWIVECKATHQKLGWCGLKFHEDEAFIDLGFRFLKSEWNKGYASEASAGCIDWARKKGIQKLIGRAMKENKASIHVLSKLGFTDWIELHNDLECGTQATLIL